MGLFQPEYVRPGTAGVARGGVGKEKAMIFMIFMITKFAQSKKMFL